MNSVLPLHAFLNRTDHSADTRTRLDQLTKELSSGRRFDTGRALRSDFSEFSQISHTLRSFDSRKATLAEGSTLLSVTQYSLASMAASSAAMRDAVGPSLSSSNSGAVESLAHIGTGTLNDIVDTLNKTHGGRAIFGRGDSSGMPIVDKAVLIGDISIIAASSTDTSSFLAGLDAYFAAGGAFETSVLAPLPLEPLKVPIGNGRTLDIPVSAADLPFRDVLKNAAIVSSLDSVGFAISASDRQFFVTELAKRNAVSEGGSIEIRGRIGSVEARVTALADALNDERVHLEARRTELVGADPFDVANRVQNEMSRLETIYAITARRSQLRLTDYLR